MRIAFFSYEFPPETGGGGIGTYLNLITKELKKAGHHPIVFCATNADTVFWEASRDYIYRIPATGWKDFNKNILEHFNPIHKLNPRSRDII